MLAFIGSVYRKDPLERSECTFSTPTTCTPMHTYISRRYFAESRELVGRGNVSRRGVNGWVSKNSLRLSSARSRGENGARTANELRGEGGRGGGGRGDIVDARIKRERGSNNAGN